MVKKCLPCNEHIIYLPSTGRPSGDFRFELNRQTQETIEPIEGDMRNMAHVSWGPNVHVAEVVLGVTTTLESKEGFSEKGHQKGQKWKVWLV